MPTAALDRPQQFLLNLALLDLLDAYAAGTGDPPTSLPGLSEPAAQFLQSAEGRQALVAWRALFGDALSYLRRFRELRQNNPQAVAGSQVGEVLQASQTALESAVRRLEVLSRP